MLQIIDDFLPAEIFTLLRNHCDALTFEGMTNPVDGIFYPGISTDIPEVVSQFFGEPKTIFMRLSLKGIKAPHQAHTDTLMGQQSLMFYLNRAEDAKGGTALVEHVVTGMRKDPIDDTQLAIWQRDTNVPEAWNVYERAEMQPNRAVVFNSNLMHRAEPVGGFGTNALNGRLVLTAFYDYPKTEAMTIRPATVEDFTALVAIGHKFFKFNPYRKYMTLDNESLINTFKLLSDQHILLVTEVAGEVVGTAGAFIAPLYWNHSQIQGLEAFWWIDPEYRKDGAGKKLRLALQQAAKAKGVNFWSMIALKESMFDEVSAAYERDGFVPVETIYMKVL